MISFDPLADVLAVAIADEMASLARHDLRNKLGIIGSSATRRFALTERPSTSSSSISTSRASHRAIELEERRLEIAELLLLAIELTEPRHPKVIAVTVPVDPI